MNQLSETLKERGNSYGDFQTLANLSQTLMAIFTKHYVSLHPDQSLPGFMVEAVHMICHKLARIANGNPYHLDSWQDIAGYSQLVVGLLEKIHQQAVDEQAKNNTQHDLTEKDNPVKPTISQVTPLSTVSNMKEH